MTHGEVGSRHSPQKGGEMRRKIDITGERFGRLVAIRKVKDEKGRLKWLCQCDCGNTKTVVVSSLLKGLTKSCGCYNRERAVETNTKHGMTNSKLYGTWCNIKNRCYNEKVDSYYLYGGRGIKMCDEWLHDFSAFARWAEANGYREDLSIDRIDVNGDYTPENCKWSSLVEQANNKRSNHLIEYNGKTQTAAQWAREVGLPRNVLYSRLYRGWSIERALTTPKSADKWHK